MEQLKTFFDGKPIHKVLDIGTGNGDFIKLISSAFPENPHYSISSENG
ncbi:MAG: hypothetical protein Q8S54_09855 [Bacteroidota bacterium]|nr:hypothetical protein [Bacteroidota bacterium]